MWAVYNVYVASARAHLSKTYEAQYTMWKKTEENWRYDVNFAAMHTSYARTYLYLLARASLFSLSPLFILCF